MHDYLSGPNVQIAFSRDLQKIPMRCNYFQLTRLLETWEKHFR